MPGTGEAVPTADENFQYTEW